jgi:hypothetical protein
VVKYRSGMPRGQDGVLHDRVHEAERRRTRLCGHIAEQPRPEPQKANPRRFACCNASEIARPRSPRAHQMRPVRRIQLSWQEPEHENVSLAVSAAGNLLPRLVTGGYFACDWRSTCLMIYSGTGRFWPDGRSCTKLDWRQGRRGTRPKSSDAEVNVGDETSMPARFTRWECPHALEPRSRRTTPVCELARSPGTGAGGCGGFRRAPHLPPDAPSSLC